jgi:two-component system response regulator YesN
MKLAKIYDKEVLENKNYIHEFLEKSSLEKLNYFEEKLEKLFDDFVNANNYNYSDITMKVLKIIESSYKEELTLEETAKSVNVTPQYLSKLFKEDTGKSFKESIIELRINEAKNLLKVSDLNIRKIAYEIGYNDPNYFIRIFKKNTGLTPKEYQRVIE